MCCTCQGTLNRGDHCNSIGATLQIKSYKMSNFAWWSACMQNVQTMLFMLFLFCSGNSNSSTAEFPAVTKVKGPILCMHDWLTSQTGLV